MRLKTVLRTLIPRPVLHVYHIAQAAVAASLLGFPARKLQVFGVTGTNGKTTTCFMIQAVLQASRRRAGLATTVRFSDGRTMWRNDAKMTTVTPSVLQRLLRAMVKQGAKSAVLEVTSHALDQARTWGIPFDTVVFTNLTHDHLDYHKDLASYRQAKELLFAAPHRVSVVNIDDPAADHFLAYPATRTLTYSLTQAADVRAEQIRETNRGIRFLLRVGNQRQPVQLKVRGRFNVANALAATAACLGSNLGLDTIVRGLESLTSIPGRMETVTTNEPFTVILDYAHTPDALKQAFETLKPTVAGKLIHVGGATGNRDRSKRPLLGAIAAQYADVCIVTNEDPDTEEPEAIMKAVADGVRRGAGRKKPVVPGKNFFMITDRAAAIGKALELAKPRDVVFITGKGDEEVMMVEGVLIPYSDRAVVARLLGKRPQ